MGLSARNLRLPIATGARTVFSVSLFLDSFLARRQAEFNWMFDRIKAQVWLLGVTVVPLVLILVILPFGRRWA
jgi:hypothetical protein